MTPTLHEYVQAALLALRAKPRERTQFGPAGRAVIRSAGERVIFGPKGQPIRVVEDERSNTQVEHGDHLHVVMRPKTVRATVSRSTGEVIQWH